MAVTKKSVLKTANKNLARRMSASETANAHKVMDEVLKDQHEGFVVVVKVTKTPQGGLHQEGVVFSEHIPPKEMLAIVASAVKASTLDILYALADVKQAEKEAENDDQAHEHDAEGNCLK